MSDIAIRVENLSKLYRIGAKEEQPRTLGQAMRSLVASPFAYLNRMQRPPTLEETLYALRDVSFEVKHGEVLGIIGRNGAGKSTLLKILSRITEPSRGEAQVYGRVGSLLEVGTGFHPELTGRENIYLNGAILGMKRTEIERKFDEIVDFSGVEKFLDTPVKRYSSGMYVRLAFAVAAHLEPEILLVDEVLAVGDIAFQKKCLGRMKTISHQGRTVLFVSHNMQAIRTLCSRSLLFNQGQIEVDGVTTDALTNYYESLQTQTKVDANMSVADFKKRRGSGAVRFQDICIQDTYGRETTEFAMGDTVRFVLTFQVFAPVDDLFVGMALRSSRTQEFITSIQHQFTAEPLSTGYRNTIVIELTDANLRPGEYLLYFQLLDTHLHSFDVVDDMTNPLLIYTNKDYEDLGYDPTSPVGFFDIESRLIRDANRLDGKDGD